MFRGHNNERDQNRRREREGDDQNEPHRGIERKDERDDEDLFNSFGMGFRSQIFRDIDRWTERMFKTYESLERQAESGRLPQNTVYYGYSISIGPDGRPEVREFGNVHPPKASLQGALELGSREPFVETTVDEKQNQLKVVAEMPGVQKDDIKAEVTDRTVSIQAERGERKYDTVVTLGNEVDPSSARARFNNGVLEVELKLKAPPKGLQQKGVSLKID